MLENEYVVGLMVAAVGWLFKLIRDLIKAKVHSEHAARLLGQLTYAVQTEVTKLMQTKVKASKLSGDWSNEMKVAIKIEAMNNVKKALGNKTVKDIAKVLGNVSGLGDVVGSMSAKKKLTEYADHIIDSAIEHAVPIAKNLVNATSKSLRESVGLAPNG